MALPTCIYVPHPHDPRSVHAVTGYLHLKYTCAGVAIMCHNQDHPLELFNMDPSEAVAPIY